MGEGSATGVPLASDVLMTLPMQSLLRQVLVVPIAMALAACGSSMASRDAVIMKLDATHAHVGLGAHEVAVGDPVIVRHHFCTPDASKGKNAEKCENRVVARGTVIEVINEQYSVVEIPHGELEEGDTVEKAVGAK